MSNYLIETDNQHLEHHGIKGMKWGVRRYQNPDGSLTAAGQKRYGGDSRDTKSLKKKLENAKSTGNQSRIKKYSDKLERSEAYDKALGEWNKQRDDYLKYKSSGRDVANVLLNGPFGAHLYTTARAAGYSRFESEGQVILSKFLLGPVGEILLDENIKLDQIAENIKKSQKG